MTDFEAQAALDKTAGLLYPLSDCSQEDAERAMRMLLDLEKRLSEANMDRIWERLEQQVEDAGDALEGRF
jgi:hypothetical protein